MSIVEKAYDPNQDLTIGTRKRPKNFEKPQFLIMIFSMKTPMHMFVRKWGLVRRIRIFYFTSFSISAIILTRKKAYSVFLASLGQWKPSRAK